MASRKKPATEHVSQMPFGELLAQFVAPTSDRGKSFTDQDMSISPALLTQMSTSKEEKSKKNSKGGTYGSLDIDGLPAVGLDDLDDLLPEKDEYYDPTFDELIETAFIEDEDVALRNNLIAMGRKYAIKGIEEDGEASEVNKAFARQEQAIYMLLEEMGNDSAAIQRDVDLLRMSRTKSYKSISDLMEVKATMHNARLAAIKELNNMKKTTYDITLKLKKEQNSDAADTGMAATQAVQRLLSVGRNNLVPDEDYDDSDFAPPVGDERPGGADYNDGRPETAIRLASDIPDAITDGDKFIEHEGEGVEMVLDVDTETGQQQIYAINKYGDVVPDYPLPSSPEQLRFQMNEMAGEATDQLQRRYIYRRNGEDVVSRSYEDPDN